MRLEPKLISRTWEPTRRPEYSGLLDFRQPSSTEVPMRRIGLAVLLGLRMLSDG